MVNAGDRPISPENVRCIQNNEKKNSERVFNFVRNREVDISNTGEYNISEGVA